MANQILVESTKEIERAARGQAGLLETECKITSLGIVIGTVVLGAAAQIIILESSHTPRPHFLRANEWVHATVELLGPGCSRHDDGLDVIRPPSNA